jgi:hypothetical protein
VSQPEQAARAEQSKNTPYALPTPENTPEAGPEPEPEFGTDVRSQAKDS